MTNPQLNSELATSDATRAPRAANASAPSDAPPIIVHSHLRWDFVWQRPQQILSRLAATRRILFVEEPLWLDDAVEPELHVTRAPQPNVFRVIPRLPSTLRDTPDASDLATRTLLKALIGPGGQMAGLFDRPVQWFYTPMAATTMIDAFDERAVVYDCMDELSKFRFAPAQIVLRERYLLSRADVVFTGGKRLHESKSRHHDNVHFYGCGVEVEHFARALDPSTPIDPAVATLPKPVAGYYGVIDERLDYELIGSLARRWTGGSVVMVGPVVKVDPADLPKAPNLHWLGQRDYADLPSIVKGFDVCLMPFALNSATEYINPTKSLEYMAAGRPVVSTAIADVVRNFGSLVRIADSHEAFIAAARQSADCPDAVQLQQAIERAALSSWESIVEEMSQHLDRAAAQRARSLRPGRTATAPTAAAGTLRKAPVHRSP